MDKESLLRCMISRCLNEKYHEDPLPAKLDPANAFHNTYPNSGQWALTIE